MTQKTAYLWGPLSSFSGPLAALLLQKGWQVHVPTKSALNLFTLAPLDLSSSAQCSLERALGGHEQLKTFQERLRLLEGAEPAKGTTYDVVIFCGLPPNFDEARAPRAPWAAAELLPVAKMLRGVPIFIVSSLWGGVQPDGVVPEELEFERRKPQSHWEGVCQQYETRVLKDLAHCESSTHLIRLPIISGAGRDGRAFNFSGLLSMLHELSEKQATLGRVGSDRQTGTLKLRYNPDATLWFLPVDTAIHLFWRILEDGSRPRICNLVSTETTLNREWIDCAARALGYQEVESVESDTFALPGILKKMLADNILVKTRNLFEVTGRYHIYPTKLDQSYFEQLLTAARADNWGKPLPEEESLPEFSHEIAEEYFERFLPANLSASELKNFTGRGTTIAFQIEVPIAARSGSGSGSGSAGGESRASGALEDAESHGSATQPAGKAGESRASGALEDAESHGSATQPAGKAGASTMSWLLKSVDGQARVARGEPDKKQSAIIVRAAGKVMISLAAGRISLPRALLLREARLDGPPLELCRFGPAFAKFLKDHPFSPQTVRENEPSVPAGAAT